MSSVSGRSSDLARSAGLALLRWQSWPLKEYPLHTTLVAGTLLAVAIAVHWLTGRVHLAVASVIVLVVTSWRFFLPVTFELSEAGIDYWVLGRRRRLAWEAVRAWKICRDGVLLLPQEDASWAAWLNGLYVPCSRHKEQFLELLERYVAPSSQH